MNCPVQMHRLRLLIYTKEAIVRQMQIMQGSIGGHSPVMSGFASRECGPVSGDETGAQANTGFPLD